MKYFVPLTALALISPTTFSQSLDLVAQEFFNEQAEQIVCHYLSGTDIEGSHDESSEIWLSCNQAIPGVTVTLTSFERISAPGASGDAVGEYSGNVVINNTGTRINIDNLLWSGEDISLEIRVIH